MAVGTQDAGSQGALVAREKAKLRKVLRRFDLILFTACAIVGLESVALAAQAGAQAITWLLVSLVLFFVPYGMVVAELGSAFPVEGGPYEWVKMSFGRLVGSIVAVLYWLTKPDMDRREPGGSRDCHAERFRGAQAARHGGRDRRRPGLHLGYCGFRHHCLPLGEMGTEHRHRRQDRGGGDLHDLVHRVPRPARSTGRGVQPG